MLVMHNELQLPVMNDTVLQSMYCIIELHVNYTERHVYVACKTIEDYDRCLTKIKKDYLEDNYILKAFKHTYNPDNTSLVVMEGNFVEHIKLIP